MLQQAYNTSLKLLHKVQNKIDSHLSGEFPTAPYRFGEQDAQIVRDVVLTGKLHHKTGPYVSLFEEEFAQYHKSKYALATNAGTSSLELAVKAIGILPGDEVIVPSYTFVATAQAVLNRGGIPVFADIDDTYTISPESVLKLVSSRTKAIIPVHIFGNVADMDKLISIAKKHKLKIIEDCAQAIGARYRGQPVGTFGEIGCFSFNEKKALTTGQGGMVITSNKKFFEIMNATRETGQLKESTGSDVITTGNTYALTEMQAVLGRSILSQIDKLNSIRKDNYDYFVSQMKYTDPLPINWYRILPHAHPSFSRLIFMIDFSKLKITRAQFITEINFQAIPFRTFYPVPLYRYSLFQNKIDAYTKNSFPFSANKTIKYKGLNQAYTEKFCVQQVGIEFSPYITHFHIRRLCQVTIELLSKNLK